MENENTKDTSASQQEARVSSAHERNIDKKSTLIVVIIAIILGFAAIGYFCIYDDTAKKSTQLYNETISLFNDIDSKKTALSETIEKADAFISGTPEDSVYEPNVIFVAQDNLESAKQCLENSNTDFMMELNGISSNAFQKAKQLDAIKNQENELIGRIDEAIDKLETSTNDISKSINRKRILDAKHALTDSVKEANSVLSDSDNIGLVCENRDALATIIDKAIDMINSDGSTADELTECKTDLVAGIDALKEDIESKKLDDAYGSASRDSNPWDTWTVNYYNDYWTTTASASGAVTQWADRYFIAHDWSENGQRITSKPAHVIIDGETYHYVSYFIDLKAQPFYTHISSFVYPNNGIGFQTCYGDAHNLILHYEPGW